MLFIGRQYRRRRLETEVRPEAIIGPPRRPPARVRPRVGRDPRRRPGDQVRPDDGGRRHARSTSPTMPTPASAIRERFARQLPGVPLVVVESPYRSLVRPLVRYLEDAGGARRRRRPRRAAARVRAAPLVGAVPLQRERPPDPRGAAGPREHPRRRGAVPAGRRGGPRRVVRRRARCRSLAAGPKVWPMAEEEVAPPAPDWGGASAAEAVPAEPAGDPDAGRAAGRHHGRRLRPDLAPDRRLRGGRGGPVHPHRDAARRARGPTGLAYVANATPSRILVPGLCWPHAIGADLAGRAVVSTIPGPTDMATQFLLYRQWSIPADAATAGIVFNAFFETLSDLVLPLIATIGVLMAGHTPRPAVIVLSVVGVVVLVLALLLLVAIVRSESLARPAGSGLQRDRPPRLGPVPPPAADGDRRRRHAGPRAVARDPVATRGPRVRGRRPRAGSPGSSSCRCRCGRSA